MREWCVALPDRHQAFVRHAMRIAAYDAVLGFLAVLNGARVVDDPPHGELGWSTPDRMVARQTTV